MIDYSVAGLAELAEDIRPRNIILSKRLKWAAEHIATLEKELAEIETERARLVHDKYEALGKLSTAISERDAAREALKEAVEAFESIQRKYAATLDDPTLEMSVSNLSMIRASWRGAASIATQTLKAIRARTLIEKGEAK